jgi:hypothetical protein
LKKERYILLLKEAQEQSLSTVDFAGVRQQLAQLLLRYGELVGLPQKCVAVGLVLREIQVRILKKQFPSQQVAMYAGQTVGPVLTIPFVFEGVPNQREYVGVTEQLQEKKDVSALKVVWAE